MALCLPYQSVPVLLFCAKACENTFEVYDGALTKKSVIDSFAHSRYYSSILLISVYGTVSAKIAPRLKCYKNASRLNRYNFPTDNAIDFLCSILHSEMV